MKGKGEKERDTHLNAQFQRIARRDKKAFLSKQCKEIEENNRMGKTRDLFKKIRDTKGTFHAKMSSIKDNWSIVFFKCSISTLIFSLIVLSTMASGTLVSYYYCRTLFLFPPFNCINY